VPSTVSAAPGSSVTLLVTFIVFNELLPLNSNANVPPGPISRLGSCVNLPPPPINFKTAFVEEAFVEYKYEPSRSVPPTQMLPA
jgi:hypothetical protein